MRKQKTSKESKFITSIISALALVMLIIQPILIPASFESHVFAVYTLMTVSWVGVSWSTVLNPNW